MVNVSDVKSGTVKEGKEIEGGMILLDTNVTKELKDEWLIRELIRSVQDMRKKMKLEIKDHVELFIPSEKLFATTERG
jgi:isoleucyl-tRNA synthetase